jgi:AraC family transcriptional regulator
MTDQPNPVFRTTEEIHLHGTMAVYNSQDEASNGIPQQWRSFLTSHPTLKTSPDLHGASPCTGDGKIHYLTGIIQQSPKDEIAGEPLILAAGEYAVVHVNDPATLRDTWGWLLDTWLPASGRHEKHAPEFERYTSIAQDGTPAGPVEIWIPLEPLRDNHRLLPEPSPSNPAQYQ